MTQSFDPRKAARYLLDAHDSRAAYCNLPADIAPRTIADAYAAQQAFARLLAPRYGRIAGLKVATTTKVMQELMGIGHPCGGMIFERSIRVSPAEIRLCDYVNLMVECELAVRLGRDLPERHSPYTRQTVSSAVASVMAAFELIEDRNADYKQTNALSLIADNCWNAGVVLGSALPFTIAHSLAGIAGSLEINGHESHRGSTDDPLATLAWIANLAVEHARPLTAGMIVITGSVIPTLALQAGDRLDFRLDGIGTTTLTAI
jgi:2-keto-4-pentenoate hydratase